MPNFASANFGADLSSVRVHQGAQAGALGAAAYTQGSDLHFGPGNSSSSAGDAMIGHELAHVVQQSAGNVTSSAGAPSGAPFAHYAD